MQFICCSVRYCNTLPSTNKYCTCSSSGKRIGYRFLFSPSNFLAAFAISLSQAKGWNSVKSRDILQSMCLDMEIWVVMHVYTLTIFICEPTTFSSEVKSRKNQREVQAAIDFIKKNTWRGMLQVKVIHQLYHKSVYYEMSTRRTK